MKTQRTLRVIAVLLALTLTLLFAGCDEKLTGKWRSTSEKETQLVFAASGKMTMSADGLELTGTYATDGTNIVMSLTAPTGQTYTIEAVYSISGNELHLENSKGQVEIFVR